MQLPLFPLHTVLCPGIALPLHIFEPRYRALVRDCVEASAPFGVVLIRNGREVGGGTISFSAIGTLAEIREAGRYPDGRYETGADIGPDEWIRLRLDIETDRVVATVNGDPTLIVNGLKAGPVSGALGLFVDIGTEAFFADLTMTPFS